MRSISRFSLAAVALAACTGAVTAFAETIRSCTQAMLAVVAKWAWSAPKIDMPMRRVTDGWDGAAVWARAQAFADGIAQRARPHVRDQWRMCHPI